MPVEHAARPGHSTGEPDDGQSPGPRARTIHVDGAGLAVEAPDGARRRVLAAVHAELTEQVVAVVGANGSGKSTLLRLIAGLVEPSEGEVRFSPAPPRTGFIFADPAAQLIMPIVGEDIAFSLRGRIRDRAAREAEVRDILASLGLEDRRRASVHDLSSGERQKVALAGVLAAEPELVVADEPTTLLDLRAAAEFRDRLLGLGVPLVLATHDLEFAGAADRVLVFDDGRLVDDDDPKAALPRYRRLALGDRAG